MRGSFLIIVSLGVFGLAFGKTSKPAKPASSAPKIPANKRKTEAKAEKKGNILSAVGDLIVWATKGNECPLSADFAKKIAENKLFTEKTCGNEYNQRMVKAILKIHQKLEALRKENPKAASSKLQGGGYDATLGTWGQKVPFSLGSTKTVEFAVDDQPHCSGATFTAVMTMIQDVGNGSIFNSMSDEQLRNFSPAEIEPLLVTAAKKEGKKIPVTVPGSNKLTLVTAADFQKNRNNPKLPQYKVILDDHGVYGIVNNNQDGFRDVSRNLKSWAIAKSVNSSSTSIKPGTENFKNACPGDIMQWDRVSKGGHSGVFLGEVDGKVYFWSANQSTKGYGVTCEAATDMKPKIERITNPYALAAIPPYTGQPNLAGPQSPEKVQALMEKLPADEAEVLRAASHQETK